MDMLTFSEKNGVLTAKISGELDHFLASDVRGRIDDMMARKMPSALILDISGVTFMDSSGIGVILGRYRRIAPRGGSMNILNAKKNIERVLRMSGVYKLCTEGEDE